MDARVNKRMLIQSAQPLLSIDRLAVEFVTPRGRVQALDDVMAPVVDRFAPTWVLVSAGFDAHRADPMAGLQLTAGDFADMAVRVKQFAPRPGRLALILEGANQGFELASRLAGSRVGRLRRIAFVDLELQQFLFARRIVAAEPDVGQLADRSARWNTFKAAFP